MEKWERMRQKCMLDNWTEHQLEITNRMVRALAHDKLVRRVREAMEADLKKRQLKELERLLRLCKERNRRKRDLENRDGGGPKPTTQIRPQRSRIPRGVENSGK